MPPLPIIWSRTYVRNGSNCVGAHAQWRAAYANPSGGVTEREDSRRVSLSASREFRMHGGGSTSMPQLGDTIVHSKAKAGAG